MRWAALSRRPPILRGLSASQIRGAHAANQARINARYGRHFQVRPSCVDATRNGKTVQTAFVKGIETYVLRLNRVIYCGRIWDSTHLPSFSISSCCLLSLMLSDWCLNAGRLERRRSTPHPNASGTFTALSIRPFTQRAGLPTGQAGLQSLTLLESMACKARVDDLINASEGLLPAGGFGGCECQ